MKRKNNNHNDGEVERRSGSTRCGTKVTPWKSFSGMFAHIDSERIAWSVEGEKEKLHTKYYDWENVNAMWWLRLVTCVAPKQAAASTTATKRMLCTLIRFVCYLRSVVEHSTSEWKHHKHRAFRFLRCVYILLFFFFFGFLRWILLLPMKWIR